MQTTHKIKLNNSKDMPAIESNSIELVITSPPYPMIEMWDEMFFNINKEIKNKIEAGKGKEAFKLMHTELNKVWEEVARVLKPGGIVAINIGDATRTVNGDFKLYPNHIEITNFFQNKDFSILPEILWRKKTNKANKFMGSGMLPSNAYVSLEHEFILLFRKGKKRKFKPKSKNRYESAYFWEERNSWFSDLWTDVKGVMQNLNHNELRERAAAFPLEVPYRLINMFSMYGDTVLDPFWGTGTTTLAAMIAARNSIGYEIKKEFTEVFDERVDNIQKLSQEINKRRIKGHLAFEKEKGESTLNYKANNYDFKVTTKQEKDINLYDVSKVQKNEEGYKIKHTKHNK